MPVGFPVVPGWYFTPALKGGQHPMLPGGMVASSGIFVMIVAGWVLFNGTPPL